MNKKEFICKYVLNEILTPNKTIDSILVDAEFAYYKICELCDPAEAASPENSAPENEYPPIIDCNEFIDRVKNILSKDLSNDSNVIKS